LVPAPGEAAVQSSHSLRTAAARAYIDLLIDTAQREYGREAPHNAQALEVVGRAGSSALPVRLASASAAPEIGIGRSFDRSADLARAGLSIAGPVGRVRPVCPRAAQSPVSRRRLDAIVTRTDRIRNEQPTDGMKQWLPVWCKRRTIFPAGPERSVTNHVEASEVSTAEPAMLLRQSMSGAESGPKSGGGTRCPVAAS
jgi:hypothetical protein